MPETNKLVTLHLAALAQTLKVRSDLALVSGITQRIKTNPLQRTTIDAVTNTILGGMKACAPGILRIEIPPKRRRRRRSRRRRRRRRKSRKTKNKKNGKEGREDKKRMEKRKRKRGSQRHGLWRSGAASVQQRRRQMGRQTERQTIRPLYNNTVTICRHYWRTRGVI